MILPYKASYYLWRRNKKNERPAVIIFPDAINKILKTFIVALLTYSAKLSIKGIKQFNNEAGEVSVDQIRAVDKKRLKKLSAIDANSAKDICSVL